MRAINKNATVKGYTFIALGCLCIILALILLVSNQQQSKNASSRSRTLLNDIEATETKQIVGVIDGMPVIRVNGEEILGILSIPKLNIRLPIISNWSYQELKNSPCRQGGSYLGNNLVIAGHNYSSHFGGLNQLSENDEVLLIDVQGNNRLYRVKNRMIVDPQDTCYADGIFWDLTLYTCTYGGKHRVLIGLEKENPAGSKI